MTGTFDRILVPTDGSDAVAPAVEMALDLAETHEATLHALFVVEPPSSFASAGEGFTGADNLLDEFEEAGHDATDAIATRADDRGITAESAVLQGTPRDDILGYATGEDVDLIVMGTHGRSGVERTLLGSVTETVVRHSEIPVLTVHRDPDE